MDSIIPEARQGVNTDAADEVTDLSCGSSHTVAVLSCGLVASWGQGEDGQLGHGDASQLLEPRAIRALVEQSIDSVHCGAEYTVALSIARGEVLSWGWGDFGRLGHGDTSDVLVPRPIAFFTGKRITSIACGDTHTLACTDEGVLYSFGRNQAGQLGLGHTNDMLLPIRVEHKLQSEHVSCISCGSEHSIVSLSNGEVYGWGWGGFGNLGNGSNDDRHVPTKITALEGQTIVSVRCGWRHSIAVTDRGRMYTFGWNKYGQCGHGDCSNQAIPRLVEALAHLEVATVAGGWRHTMAGDRNGNLYGWGWNKFGQLGVGDVEDRHLPTLVPSLRETVRTLACGWRHTVAVTETGQVFSWGRGVVGQLGHGREEDLDIPTLLTSLSRGVLRRDTLLATNAASACGFVALEDRYAVVPNGVLDPAPTLHKHQQEVPGCDAPSQKAHLHADETSCQHTHPVGEKTTNSTEDCDHELSMSFLLSVPDMDGEGIGAGVDLNSSAKKKPRTGLAS